MFLSGVSSASLGLGQGWTLGWSFVRLAADWSNAGPNGFLILVQPVFFLISSFFFFFYSLPADWKRPNLAPECHACVLQRDVLRWKHGVLETWIETRSPWLHVLFFSFTLIFKSPKSIFRVDSKLLQITYQNTAALALCLLHPGKITGCSFLLKLMLCWASNILDKTNVLQSGKKTKWFQGA